MWFLFEERKRGKVSIQTKKQTLGEHLCGDLLSKWSMRSQNRKLK